MPELGNEQLLQELDFLSDTMIAVATHRQVIQDVNDEFRRRYANVAAELSRRRIDNPLTFGDLWDWYGRWKRDLPTYQSRREYVSELVGPLRNRIATGRAEIHEPTGWPRVDRVLDSLAVDLPAAQTEEEFQAIALSCREALISLSQAVHDPDRHPTLDGVVASADDAKRKLEAYVAAELPGEGNEEARRFAKAAVLLAVNLQHKRTASFRDAALCLEATRSVVNSIAIIAGRRDRESPV